MACQCGCNVVLYHDTAIGRPSFLENWEKIRCIIKWLQNFPSWWQVQVGVHNMDKPEGCEQEIAIKKVYLHPEWDIVSKNTSNGVKISTSHDIALLQLSKPVKITSKVKSMCLDNGQRFDAGKTQKELPCCDDLHTKINKVLFQHYFRHSRLAPKGNSCSRPLTVAKRGWTGLGWWPARNTSRGTCWWRNHQSRLLPLLLRTHWTSVDLRPDLSVFIGYSSFLNYQNRRLWACAAWPSA